mgnify:CR=1 FL=1
MDTMYKFQPIMQLARKIDSDEIKSKENLINNIKRIFKKENNILILR